MSKKMKSTCYYHKFLTKANNHLVKAVRLQSLTNNGMLPELGVSWHVEHKSARITISDDTDVILRTLQWGKASVTYENVVTNDLF